MWSGAARQRVSNSLHYPGQIKGLIAVHTRPPITPILEESRAEKQSKGQAKCLRSTLPTEVIKYLVLNIDCYMYFASFSFCFDIKLFNSCRTCPAELNKKRAEVARSSLSLTPRSREFQRSLSYCPSRTGLEVGQNAWVHHGSSGNNGNF